MLEGEDNAEKKLEKTSSNKAMITSLSLLRKDLETGEKKDRYDINSIVDTPLNFSRLTKASHASNLNFDEAKSSSAPASPRNCLENEVFNNADGQGIFNYTENRICESAGSSTVRSLSCKRRRATISSYEDDKTYDTVLATTKGKSLVASPFISPSYSLFGQSQSFTPYSSKVVLSIDGGGTRGLMPAILLREICRQLPNFSPDMIAGTSVGALVGMAFAIGKIDDFINDFRNIAQQIFTKNWSYCNPLNWFQTTRGFFGPLYKTMPKKRAIQDFLDQTQAGDLEQKFDYQNLKCRLLFPFYSLQNRKVTFYQNYNATRSFGLVDTLMSTTAAPSFYDPYIFTGLDKNRHECIDGGVYVNNPALLAYQEARAEFPNSKIIMLSLGTGEHDYNDENEHSSRRGKLYWAQRYPTISIEGTSRYIHCIMDKKAESDSVLLDYFRINPKLRRGLMIMDGTSKKYIDDLTSSAVSIIAERDSRGTFNSFINFMKNPGIRSGGPSSEATTARVHQTINRDNTNYKEPDHNEDNS
ncbi:MAG: patatin-like phospholipase family protein [Holosporaceae bacterium]|jgi:predicted acylesterase/phospholipase RssA|nr:patatin-like phospholipase family protein [Holosporaceae bacterium]